MTDTNAVYLHGFSSVEQARLVKQARVGMTEDGAVPQTGQMPNTVYLYRRAILDYWAENEETLGDIITHVLIHEIGHHFGFSDEDMEAIEARHGRPRPRDPADRARRGAGARVPDPAGQPA